MHKSASILSFLACTAILFLFAAAPALAANHALLIGIKNYAEARDLEGPVNDVDALEAFLIENSGFLPKNITTLIDQQATRNNILSELERLRHTTRPGDFIFFFFSGHGTSPKSGDDLDWGPETFTGGILPYDYSDAGTKEDCFSRLIVGNRDIRPIFDELDRDRKIFVIYDACFSQYSIRSLLPKGMPKHHIMKPSKDSSDDPMDEEGPTDFNTPDIQPPAYPYKNILFFSASGSSEKAMDIPLRTIFNGFETVDGKPHGALTNYLLEGLKSGCADTDTNSKITYAELYAYAKNNVYANFPHTPQILSPKDNNQLLSEVIFAGNGTVPPSKACQVYQPNATLKVKLPDESGALVNALKPMTQVEIVTREFDLEVKKMGQGYHLLQPNANPVVRGAIATQDDLIRIIANRTLIKDLVEYRFPKSSFNIFADLLKPSGLLKEGDDIGFKFRPDADCTLFVVNVSSTGDITVLYPHKYHELEPVPANHEIKMDEKTFGHVTGPDFGQEIVKVFAFKKRPENLSKFRGRSFSPTSPEFKEMMQMIKSADEGAEAVIQAQTCKKEDLVVGN